MAQKDKFYITTAIAYVNAAPHIGFAMEVLQADCLARYHRVIGDDVWFLTGVDEHGSKIKQTAKDQGVAPQDILDKYTPLFQDLGKSLNFSNNDFIRTSEERHKTGAKKLWRKLIEAGDIYRSKYQGFYCVGCEAFVTEKDLVDGKCPEHNKKPELITEENHFFKLSKYSKKIADLIRSDELKILPEARKNEILSLCEEGLTDVSFSRPKSHLDWGISVPDDDDQVMYVWCDALSNYITALGYAGEEEKFGRYWPADVHLIGKGILRFHAGVWIGMLLSAKLPLPRAIYVHGYITSDGQKMSKSIGNVIDPFAVTEKYGVDSIRYFLLREIPTSEDGDFSDMRFKVVYESELADNFGNLFARVLAMTEKYFGGVVPEISSDARMVNLLKDAWFEYDKYFNNFDLKKACEEIVKVAVVANQYVEDNKPWQLAKTDKDALGRVMYNLLEVLRQIACMLYPFIPGTADAMLKSLGMGKIYDEGTSVEFRKWGFLKKGGKVEKVGVLFPKENR
ncbi:MAG: methionyl-tRNA synthetase, methionyl-tRNA synthetase [Candidatus Peregrinibacteria bacterium GW2011_GWF2_43_17]|nr:MAG: methionyl-tRNA synthetase, methionyl-tRNA synthetase [Candidatus Peregrinibacteria bacterium GW2011_GWF2_43_17]KKT20496.1 MAG: Methionine-tRNA ligase [Candidatus Peregrinibacteria bacterium GW2011_GWA2_43_8]HAU40299.1 methionine--tRNA ligase [Candidatus Peregrinibacteria bacterium]